MGENHQTKFGQVRTRSEQSAKDFSLKETKFLKRKSVDTFNASSSRQPGRPLTFLKSRLIEYGREPPNEVWSGSNEERAECEGFFFERNEVSEKKIRRHV